MIKSFFRGILIAVPFVVFGLVFLCIRLKVEGASCYDTLLLKKTGEDGYVIEVGRKSTAVAGKHYFNRWQVPQNGETVSTAIVNDVQYLAYGKLSTWQWRVWWGIHQTIEWIVWVLIYAICLLLIARLVWRK